MEIKHGSMPKSEKIIALTKEEIQKRKKDKKEGEMIVGHWLRLC